MTRLDDFNKANEQYNRADGTMRRLAADVLLELIDFYVPGVEYFVYTTPSDANDYSVLELVDGEFVIDAAGAVTSWTPLTPPADLRHHTAWHDVVQAMPLRVIFDCSIAEQRENKWYNMENYVSVAKIREHIQN